MKFSGLQKSKEAVAVGDLDRIENKQRVSLSTHAYTVLLNDLSVFHPQEAAQLKGGEIPSFFINHIFSCFKNTARSSIAQAVQNQKFLLDHILQNMEDIQAKQRAMDLLLSAFEQNLKEEQNRRCAQKGHTVVFRINTKNLNYLLSDEGQAEGAIYNDRIGAYVKALLEEFSENPYVEREKIYFKVKLDEIQLAIHQKKLLKLVLFSKTQRGNNIIYVKPLTVQQDAERLYNYLVGMISSDREGPWRIGSVRLTSIQGCMKQEHPVSISAQTRKEIETAIREKGVQFLSDEQDAQRIVVKFTQRGEKMYRSMLHLRPQLAEKLDDRTYAFSCSLRQADNYFFKFGKHAKIIEPMELAERFRKHYASAEEQYVVIPNL